MSESPRARRAAVAAVGVYLAGVALPLAVLFLGVVLRTPAGAARTVARAPVAPPEATGFPAPPEESGVQQFSAAEAPAFPELSLVALADGTETPLSALRSGPVLVHLWSLSCESCAAEWPLFRAFLAARAQAPGTLPPVLAVLVVPAERAEAAAATREALADLRREGWFGRSGADLDVRWLVPEDAVLSQAGRPTAERPITGYPETFLLDERGRVRVRVVGPSGWDVRDWSGWYAGLTAPGAAPHASAVDAVPNLR